MPRLLSPSAIDAIFTRWQAADPRPQTELDYTSPFTLLIAVVLSAQATDVGVNKATARLFPVADTPEKILALGEDGLKAYIKTIGLFNSKARNIIALCRQLLEMHDGQVPEDHDALTALPGVGRKTANVVLNCAFGWPMLAVDTHVHRVSNRMGFVHSKTPEQTEKQLLKRIPERWLLHAHHWLILHGRYICQARRPRCPICPVRDYCLYPDKTREK